MNRFHRLLACNENASPSFYISFTIRSGICFVLGLGGQNSRIPLSCKVCGQRQSMKGANDFQSIKSIMLSTSVQSSGEVSNDSSSTSLNVSLGPYEMHSSSPSLISRSVV
jgi:hypothetical protein